MIDVVIDEFQSSPAVNGYSSTEQLAGALLTLVLRCSVNISIQIRRRLCQHIFWSLHFYIFIWWSH